MSWLDDAVAIIGRHGHDVVRVTRDFARPCPCRNELRQEATCARCLGTGYKIRAQKGRAYVKKNATGAMPDTRKEQAAGADDVRTYVFYFAGDPGLATGDLIVERVGDVYVTHVISTVDLSRDAGEAVYAAVFTKRRGA